MQETMTIKQVAEKLHLHPVTVRRMAKNGDLPARKLGRKWHFLKEAIEEKITPEVPTQTA